MRVLSRFLALATTVGLLIAVSFEAHAQATLYNGFGGSLDFGVEELGPNDDGSSAEISLPSGSFPAGLNVLGSSYASLWVNNNGNVSFVGGLPSYTPQPFPSTAQPMLAPYFADVDTRGTAINPALGRQPANGVFWHFPGDGRFVVTWYEVGYYSQHTDLLMSFQLVITDRSDIVAGDFDVEYRYNRCEWTTGDASGGSGGLGGVPAQMGWDWGDGVNAYLHPDSQTAQILDLCISSNIGDTGVYSFSARSGAIPYCGNGVEETGEGCDDANLVPDDGCDVCVLEVCGDGIANDGTEACDVTDFRGLAVCPAGSTGTPLCNNDPANTAGDGTCTVDAIPDGCADVTPPEIVHVHSVSGTEIIVWFDEDLDQLDAEVAGSYLVDASISPGTVSLDAVDHKQVTLTGLGGLTPGTVVSLAVIGVEDLAGNPSDSIADYYVGVLPMSVPQSDDADGLPTMDPGAFFTVHGWATGTVFSPNVATVYDRTGGINLRDATAVAALSEGDEVRISGRISSLNGEADIGTGPDTTRGFVLSSSNEMPVLCLDVPTYSGDPESFEGYLVGFESLTLVGGTWPTPGTAAQLLFEDGAANQVELSMVAATDIDDSAEPIWPIGIIGIAGQFDETAPHEQGYQARPRSIADFDLNVCDCTPAFTSPYWWLPGADSCAPLCPPAFEDCDGIQANGCETDLSDITTCGGCTVSCDDGNACTNDACDTVNGCVSTANTTTCDDGDACTTGDICAAGSCAGAAVSCDDGNLCTDDSCDAGSGCVNTANTTTCDDGDACTTADVCTAGSCTGSAVDCDDGNACNGLETCDFAAGCRPGMAPNCDDSDPCTDDTCNPATGCENTGTCDDSPGLGGPSGGCSCSVGEPRIGRWAWLLVLAAVVCLRRSRR